MSMLEFMGLFGDFIIVDFMCNCRVCFFLLDVIVEVIISDILFWILVNCCFFLFVLLVFVMEIIEGNYICICIIGILNENGLM